MIYFLATVLLLSILVFVHELGHFLAAKSVGIRVETFSLGFPPTIFKRKKGDTVYAIGAIPFGGYVRMSGMIDESMDTSFEGLPPQPYEYRAKNTWQKIFATIAGILMNLLLAVVIFSILSGIQGIASTNNEPVLNVVVEEAPAGLAGLQSGDRIIRINENNISTWDEMAVYIRAAGGTEIQITFERDGVESTVPITPQMQNLFKMDKWFNMVLLAFPPLSRWKKPVFSEP
jgi:regulator of sigma E protease